MNYDVSIVHPRNAHFTFAYPFHVIRPWSASLLYTTKYKGAPPMPLDALKIAHIQAVTQKVFTGRTQTVIFVTLAGGTYSYQPVTAILRPQTVIDPQVLDENARPPQPAFEMLMLTMTGVNYTGVLYVANTATATASAVAAAPKYEIIVTLPVGMIPGGTHIVSKLRRLR
jgi:hypothetical protein